MEYKKTKKEILEILKHKNSINITKIAQEINCGISTLQKWIESKNETDKYITKQLVLKMKYFKDLCEIKYKKTNSNMKLLFLFLIIPLIGIGILVTALIYRGMNKPEIEIVYPENNLVLDAIEMKKLPTGDLVIHVQLNLKNIPQDKYISLLLKVSGGAAYWYSGNSLYTTGLTDQETIGYVTLGRDNDNNENYEMLAVLTDDMKVSGQTVHEIPKYIAASKKCIIRVKKIQ